METIAITSGNALSRAAAVLRAGGVILYPTDTLYGLGADAFSDSSVAKLHEIKDRDEKKPIHCVVADLAMAEHYAEIGDAARKLAEKFLPGPLTLILRKQADVDGGIAKEMTTLGIRIPKNDFCLALARAVGPYTTTSANKAGAPSPRRIGEILAQLGEMDPTIDLCIDAGALPESKPSTVVDLSGIQPKILREGAVPSSEILTALGV